MKICQNWKNIWNMRTELDPSLPLQQALIYADGFDSGNGRIDEQDWREYVQHIEKILQKGITEKRQFSIFEVGCGSGAFLYNFYTRGFTVGGIDYSEGLLNIAKKIMPNGNFILGEATTIPDSIIADFFISNGVFFYFPNLCYAKSVLLFMIQHCKKGLAILEVSDSDTKSEFEELRRDSLPEGEYEKKYMNLSHLYYDKNWFLEIGNEMGMVVEIHQMNTIFPKYGNGKYRFNVIMRKPI